MPGLSILALAELADGAPTRLSLELASLATELASASGGEAAAAAIGTGAASAAAPLAEHVARVLAIDAEVDGERPTATVMAAALLSLLDARPALGAVGGVFRGTPPRSVLEQLQSNEYERYGVQVDVTGRTAVLTGTGSAASAAPNPGAGPTWRSRSASPSIRRMASRRIQATGESARRTRRQRT